MDQGRWEGVMELVLMVALGLGVLGAVAIGGFLLYVDLMW